MCGRFIQVININTIESTYGISVPENEKPDPAYNVAPGDYAYVISSDAPKKLSRYQFGMTPSWAKKPMYLFNARSEGDANKENSPSFTGGKGIIKKPAFRKPIRSQRCIIMVNAFVEGPEKEKLDKPFVIARKDKGYLSLAGIWDTWTDKQTGEEIHSFAIITTVANELTGLIGHTRSPVIIPNGKEQKWLNPDQPLVDVLRLLKPYPSEQLKAVPISVKIKNPKNKGKEILIPVGEPITTDNPINVSKDIKLQGMGTGKRKEDPPDWQRKLFNPEN